MSFHLFRIDELYSNADGTIQFVELTTTANNEGFWVGQSLTVTQGVSSHSITFTNLPDPIATANKMVLVATQGFADLNIAQPDFIIPAGFLFTTGSATVNYAGVQSVPYSALPTDGTHSIDASGLVGVNSPTNFAGQTGTVVVNGPPSVAHPLDDQFAGNGQAFEFAIPAGAFVDAEHDPLSYAAALVGGAPLPSWLAFDNGLLTFSGTPGPSDVGGIAVRVTVSDAEGSVTDDFNLSVLSGHVLTGGAGNDTLTGTPDADRLTGLGGDDTLDGGAGNDVMIGGAGNDTYVLDNSGDSAVELAGAGTDTVVSAFSYVLGANFENLTLTGSANLNGTGNAGANVLVGNSGDNVLDGGAGNDTMSGGDGNDTYVVDVAGDVITEQPGEGIDLVLSPITWTLAVNVDNLTLTGTANINATGNGLDNVLTGNDGANRLDGGGGADTMAGGAGNDVYVVDNAGDTVNDSGPGFDRVESSVSFTLGAGIENLTLTGSGNIDATGNGLDNVLTGNAGNNVLDGGAGNDTMIGGGGNDTYFVIESGDTVIDSGGSSDTVVSSRSIDLGGAAAGIENLTLLAGSDAISAIGNAQDNVLVGNGNDNVLTGAGGNDLLQGGLGYDSMTGGTGNDTYYVNRGDGAGVAFLAPNEDTVVEALNAGTDTVHSSLYTYTLGANVENLVLDGSGRKGFGNELNNAMTGDGLANTLDGGAGNDTLDGGAGNDVMIGGAGNDTFVFDNLSGVDRVLDYSVANDSIELSLATFSGIGTIGDFNVDALVASAAPVELDGNAHILYNTSTGALYYDDDGAGGDAAVQFALLAGAPPLTAAEFAVVS